MSEEHLILVFTNAASGQEDEFNEWYDDVHLAEVSALPNVVGAQRYDHAGEFGGLGNGEHGYLAIYEVSGDIDETMAALTEAVTSGSMVVPDAVDQDSTRLVVQTKR